MILLEKFKILTPLQNLLLKSCPKSKKSPNLVTLWGGTYFGIGLDEKSAIWSACKLLMFSGISGMSGKRKNWFIHLIVKRITAWIAEWSLHLTFEHSYDMPWAVSLRLGDNNSIWTQAQHLCITSWFIFDLSDLILHYLSVKFFIELWNRKRKINEIYLFKKTCSLQTLLQKPIDVMPLSMTITVSKDGTMLYSRNSCNILY